jgi:hypothetical protein
LKDQLYLLRPGFLNAGQGPFYCGDCVSVEGLLGFFPDLRSQVDVHYLDFPRPRAPLADLLGEENQGVPVLILANGRALQDPGLEPKSAKGQRFLADEKAIRHYLSSQYGKPAAS